MLIDCILMIKSMQRTLPEELLTLEAEYVTSGKVDNLSKVYIGGCLGNLLFVISCLLIVMPNDSFSDAMFGSRVPLLYDALGKFLRDLGLLSQVTFAMIFLPCNLDIIHLFHFPTQSLS